MHMFTALFDHLPDAEAAQRRLTELGIVDLDDHKVHDQSSPAFDRERFSTNEDRGLWSDPKLMFPPDEDRRMHEEHLRRGGYLLTVTVDDAEAEQVQEVLESSNAIDVEERERKYKDEGLAAAPLVERGGGAGGEEIIPLVEETLRVGKRQVDRGGLKVRSYTVETPVSAAVDLREEHVSVERRALNAPIDGREDLFVERTVEASEHSEQAVVGKETRVVEELTLRKDVSEREETISDTVRHTEVEVERTTPNDTDGRERS